MLTDTKAEIVSTLVSSSKKIPINYRLVLRNGEWRVYDLVIEGISLVSNYRNSVQKLFQQALDRFLIFFEPFLFHILLNPFVLKNLFFDLFPGDRFRV